MTNQTPRIDDRTMQDLFDEAKRLIPRICPEWTNHGPTDPGIALIEIFAWMTDQLIQRLNDVPEQVYDAFLRLIGLDTFPARAAVADVVFFASEGVSAPVAIPAGTVVGTPSTSDGSGIDFQTDVDSYLLPADLQFVFTAGPDGVLVDARGALAEPGAGLAVFEPLAPGSALLLGFRQPCADHVLSLDVDAGVEGLGIDPSNPPIVWEAWGGGRWQQAMLVSDETGGLQRQGRVVVLLPDEVDALPMGGHRAHWLRARLTTSPAGRASYLVSPRMSALRATTGGLSVRVTHSSPTDAEYLGTADGSPGLTFQTSRHPVLPLSSQEELIVVEPDGEATWTEVADFSASGPGDRHFTFSSDTGTVRFGPRVHYRDGSVVQHGMAPLAGSDVRLSGYRVGGGAVGNVGAGTIACLKTTVPYIAAVRNFAPAIGGCDAETIENARLRAPLWLQTGGRAVTAADFERLARWAHPGVARAKCYEGEDRKVNLAIVPDVTFRGSDTSVEDFAVDDGVLADVARYIDERRLLGTAVEISAAKYRGVSVVAKASASPGRDPRRVERHCLDALGRLLHPVEGGSDRRGWPFDQPVDANTIAAALGSVDGVELVDEVLLFDADTKDLIRRGQAVHRIRLGPRELPLLVSPQVVIR